MLWYCDDTKLWDLVRFHFLTLYVMAVLVFFLLRPEQSHTNGMGRPDCRSPPKSWHLLFVARLGNFFSRGRNQQSWDTPESKIVCPAEAFTEEGPVTAGTQLAPLEPPLPPCWRVQALLARQCFLSTSPHFSMRRSSLGSPGCPSWFLMSPIILLWW